MNEKLLLKILMNSIFVTTDQFFCYWRRLGKMKFSPSKAKYFDQEYYQMWIFHLFCSPCCSSLINKSRNYQLISRSVIDRTRKSAYYIIYVVDDDDDNEYKPNRGQQYFCLRSIVTNHREASYVEQCYYSFRLSVHLSIIFSRINNIF